MKPYVHPPLGEVGLPEVMQALADPCRLEILRHLLAAGELACGEVPLKVSKATASHHFTVLREAGLIRTRVDGSRCLNSVRAEELEERFPRLLALLAAEFPEAPAASRPGG